jgi:hypothetical protein
MAGLKRAELRRLKLKMAVFWFVAPCSLEEVYQRFRGSLLSSSIIKAMSRPDDGGRK